MIAQGTIIISNVMLGDDVFESVSHGNWNVTRALRDCLAGKHQLFVFSVPEVLEAAKDSECDEAKVAAMVAEPERLMKAPGLIFVNIGNVLWMIDGLHRIRALARLNVPKSIGYVIAEKDQAPYRVLYNGQPLAPWQKQR